ncbi:MAG TPA: sigma-70 family RNA polymerase sigma factor [Candidatus Sulfotelmatobacter sp.]|nr:sigma-70 family RNA polymerase sigma factor [Candidatus Sulfotelmatobacter sp.]
MKDWEDQDSWQEFFSIYRRLIFSTALKAGLSESEAEDVLQETVLSVAKTIKDFQYDRSRCTFKSWLRHLTQKRIADRFRKRARESLASPSPTTQTEGTALLERLPDPASPDWDAIWEQEWQQNLLDAALERVKSQISPEQFQIFDFYVLRKMPVKRVAAALEVNVAQIYLAKHRVSRLIKKEAKYLESRMG